MPALFLTSSTPLGALTDAVSDRAYHSGVDADATVGENWSEYDPSFIESPRFEAPILTAAAPLFTPIVQFQTETDQLHGMGDPWFEEIIILPQAFDFGLIISTQQATFEIYNADRYLSHDLTAVINNIGAGVDIIDLPSLPETINRQRGIVLTLQVTTDGPSSADDTIDFEFDSGLILLMLSVSFQTIILWGLQPEDGYDETLEFLTEVLPKKGGGEQRLSPRKSPRQLFALPYKLRSGTERARFENLLFHHQSRVFGLPIWHEQSWLTVAASVNDTTVNVAGTDFRDLRIGGLAVILTSQGIFDVLTIDSLTSTTITFTSPVLNDHAVGTLVMPLRTAVMPGQLPGGRFPVGLSTLTVPFRVLDNDVDLADASAFGSYNGKVLIEDYLGVQGTSPESFEQELVVLDPGWGPSYQDSARDRGRRIGQMMLVGSGLQRKWELRGLAHTLRGRQISFYLPTHLDDLEVVAPLSSGSAILDIEHVGYTANVQARQPKAVIRITFNNGDPQLIRTVSGSVVIDADTERLTLGSTWPANYTVDEVDRIEYIELVRQDTDSIVLRHEPGFQAVRMIAPVRSLPVS